jgi:CRP/FNR family transcriptional regulator, cyclic AMP receptor protein
MNSSTDQKPAPSEYQANLEILMQLPVFSGLPIELMKVLAYLCKRETFRPGEFLFRQFEVDSNAYLILSGEAGLIDEEHGGAEYAVFQEQAFLGAISLFCDVKRLFSLRANTRLTCLILSREKFQKTLERFPELDTLIFKSVLLRVYEWEERLVREHACTCTDCRKWVGISLI